MFSILLLNSLILSLNCLSVDVIENDLNYPIDKILLHNDHLFVGTKNFLHRLSPLTLNKTSKSLKLISQIDNPSCAQCDKNTHVKILLSTPSGDILLCQTSHQGLCQIVDQELNFVINSSLPIVANDPVNSTTALIIPERNLVYFGVTCTNDGSQRWQIPNISGRSLDLSRFMSILSTNDDKRISREELLLRFMGRQQARFIVQYVFSFYTDNYIYFITNQPNDLEQKYILTKIIRFCRDSSNSIIRSYIEIPLTCFNADWIVKSADLMYDDNHEQVLVGHFTRKDGAGGTSACLWNIQRDIDRAFEDNYRACYAMGIGNRGLAFIKPNEPCRKDDTWSIPINDSNLCPRIINDRLPYPIGGTIPAVGRLIYENLHESSSALRIHSFGLSSLIFQGLNNGTFKLGLFDFGVDINWLYSHQLPTQSSIHSNVIFDNKTEALFVASDSKVYRISFTGDCTSRLSCDECLSSSNNPLCGWCTMNQRCSLANNCPLSSWQQESNQCTHIVDVQPLKASVDDSQWINLTLTKLPQLEHNEIYQCIFIGKTTSASTQAIKLDHNHLSCPTPSKSVHVQSATLDVRLSIVKLPSNISIATVPQFTFYNCSSHSSCVSCRSEVGCHWCAEKCSSMCAESSVRCPSFDLINRSSNFLESNQPAEIPLKFDNVQYSAGIECRLNQTSRGVVDVNHSCWLGRTPEIDHENEQMRFLTVHRNDVQIGNAVKVFIFRCDLYETCHQCSLRSACTWCQGRCLPRSASKCLLDEQCTSLRINDFSPKSIPMRGKAIVNIQLDGYVNENIAEVSLADVPCSVMNSSSTVQCQSHAVDSPRRGPISIRFSNSVYILSKSLIEYCQPSVNSISPGTVYERGGQVLNLNGQDLLIGNERRIFIDNYPCMPVRQVLSNTLSCRLPSMPPKTYNISVKIDHQLINVAQKLRVTPNPVVQDIDPTISFASGGRLVVVRGKYFGSSQTITVMFSYGKWNEKLEINSDEVLSTEDGMFSSFSFRTPSIPLSSNEFPSPPVDVNLSLYFDHSIISLPDIIQFRYIPDIIFNISSTPPTLKYIGGELKIHVENLTEALSMSDVQLFIGCSECKLSTFTPKGIACQPPVELTNSTSIVLNNQQEKDDCTSFNSSIGPIRFRIGYREYLIGYLSYSRPHSAWHHHFTPVTIYKILIGCLVTIIGLSPCLVFFLCFARAQSKVDRSSKTTASSQSERPFWSTETSASTAPYYQVYEQISSISSRNNTLVRAPLLLCPHYQEKRNTPPVMEQLQVNLSFLTTMSVDDDQLKQLLFKRDQKRLSPAKCRASMELFYDLLSMRPFAQAFLNQLFKENFHDLAESYVYLFRYSPHDFRPFPVRREILFLQFFSSLFLQPKSDLISKFHLFDDFLRILIDSIDSSPCDEVLNRASRSISSSTLLVNSIPYYSYELSINYENLFHFHINVLDCDSINKLKQKMVHYLNSHENTNRLIEYDEIDLLVPPLNSCGDQIPMLKTSLTNTTIFCQKNVQARSEPKKFFYHLCTEDQLIQEQSLVQEKLRENKHRLQEILIYFYQRIGNGMNLFDVFNDSSKQQGDGSAAFQQYIQLVSDLIRRLNRLLLCRSTCPIIESCLGVVADGLEFIFDTKTDISPEIRFMFAEDKAHFSSFNRNNFSLGCSTQPSLQFSLADTRSIVLNEDFAIESLFRLYQFYELYSEPINQHIGENHVSVLLPIHHLLVQIRQLLLSDTTTLI